jgi:tRNA(Ile)-lysidine synthase
MSGAQSCLTTAFAAAMDKLGPFEPHPAVAVAVSGGADSTTLAILAREWTHRRDGSVLALVVDHGLRPASADEARITIERLTALDIPATLLSLSDLNHGPALAERARIMRYAVLTDACRKAGILHLLLGHHAADQVETLAMRVLRGSRTHGLAGMAALSETQGLRLLRPLLAIEPSRLRHFLTIAGIGWIEDPSNQDARAMRPRLRRRLAIHMPHDTGIPAASAAVGRLRSLEETQIAAELAVRAIIRPEGFALLSPGRIGSTALSALVQTIGGMSYPANPDQVGGLAAQPKSASIAGVRIMPAGRFGDGWLIAREEAAILAPVEAVPNAIWDRRFRLVARRPFPSGTTIGKLGDDAPRFRSSSDLPSALLRTLPALRFGKVLAAVPHLGYVSHEDDERVTMVFSPPKPAAGPCFMPVG